MGNNDASDTVRTSDFGFAINTGNIINGIVVVVARKRTGGDDNCKLMSNFLTRFRLDGNCFATIIRSNFGNTNYFLVIDHNCFWQWNFWILDQVIVPPK
jgi:hypothetical protein